jgi:hypothetical protein
VENHEEYVVVGLVVHMHITTNYQKHY